MLPPRGNAVRTHCFVDADLAGNTVTRQSQTGILIFVNRAPAIWYSKRQNTVEVSTFGSEITAMKNAIELIEALRYKLRMFGVPIDGATNICVKFGLARYTASAFDPCFSLRGLANSLGDFRSVCFALLDGFEEGDESFAVSFVLLPLRFFVTEVVCVSYFKAGELLALCDNDCLALGGSRVLRGLVVTAVSVWV